MKYCTIALGLIFSLSAIAVNTEYEKIFYNIYGRYCSSNSTYVGKEAALAVADEAIAKKLDLKEFELAWHRSCDINVSFYFARGVAAGTMDSKAFHLIHGRSCGSGTTGVSSNGALTIAQEVAAKKLDLKAFEYAWHRTCNFDSSVRLAKAVAAGETDLDTYKKILHQTCNNNYSYIGNDGSITAAKKVTAGKMNLDSFLVAWIRTCDFDTAITIGQRVMSSSTSEQGSSQERKKDSTGSAE